MVIWHICGLQDGSTTKKHQATLHLPTRLRSFSAPTQGGQLVDYGLGGGAKVATVLCFKSQPEVLVGCIACLLDPGKLNIAIQYC